MPKNKCPKCGILNSAKAKFCSRCGTKLLDLISDESLFYDHQQFKKAKEALSEKYSLIREIGHGGMAVVYLAIQKNLNRPVALKIIKSVLLNDQESIERFHEEAKTAGSLNHPNIITIHDEGEAMGVHYIAMEYLEGEDLLKIIRKNGPLNKDIFQNYFSQIASALQYLQDRDLVHRDIKSSNIFITTSGRPVLMDFGIANLKSRKVSSEDQSIIGTPEYMSPEQIKGEKVDEKTDLYSLGIVMYECITGHVPFKGNTYQETREKILHEIPLKIRDLNPRADLSISRIIDRLITKDPVHRFSNGTELYQALNSGNTLTKLKKSHLIGAIALLSAIIVISSILLMMPDSEHIEHHQSVPLSTQPERPVQIHNKGDESKMPSPDQKADPSPSVKPGHSGTIIDSIPHKSQERTPTGPSNAKLFESYMDKGDELFEKGDYIEARSNYQRAKQIDPDAISPDQRILEINSKIKNPPK